MLCLLQDTAPDLDDKLSSEQLSDIGEVLDALKDKSAPLSKEKEELQELKEDRKEYCEVRMKLIFDETVQFTEDFCLWNGGLQTEKCKVLVKVL